MTLRERKASPSVASKSKPASSSTATATSHKVVYEFGGPVGSFLTMLLLPVVIYFLFFAARKEFKFNIYNAPEFLEYLQLEVNNVVIFSVKGLLVVLGWFLFHVLLERVLFYDKVYGVKLETGERLPYRISAHLQFWVSLLVLCFGFPVFHPDTKEFVKLTSLPLDWIYDHFLELATGSFVVSYIGAVLLYAKSFKKGALLARGGNTGNVVYDFFIGRELNPRIRDFDLKEFCELRPGLIGWMTINIGCMMKQYSLLGKVTPEMLLVNLFQGLYVFDGLYHERSILTTMDITTDGFGWMLCFGDLSWVPFSYSLQARYLVENSPGYSTQHLALICLLKAIGYTIFRGANLEKDMFRRDPNSEDVAHLDTLTTKSGRKLLISGWWGMARKINYTGDWLMGLSWSLTTGFDCVVTYFYPIFFFILLVHRALRDDHACAEKYGSDWQRYKEKVPYIFIPGVI